MTSEEHKIMEALLEEYVQICHMFLVRLNSHETYINAHNLLHPEEPKIIQFLPNPFGGVK